MPVSFDRCFGWLHWPIDPVEIGIVFCNGIGRDASNAHRSLRVLADATAEAGYPTLRFDYPGTGDSLDPAISDRWQSWIDATRDATRAVRNWTGARSIILVGFRLGGLLAAIAAGSGGEIAGLALVEPVIRGRSAVSQMKVEGRLRPSAEEAPDGGLILNEIRLTTSDVAALAAIDLRDVRPCGPVAIFSETISTALQSCLDEWERCGIDADRRDLGGLDVLLRPSHQADELVDPAPLLRWLSGRFSGVPSRQTHPRVGPTPCLRPPGGLETPVRFGENNRLAGILCQPEGVPCNRAVVIVNPGGDSHHGYARFSVQFARTLARSGLASFRFDFGGLGDSASPAPDGIEMPTDVFRVGRTADIGAALDVLELLGFQRFSLHGLCSGAYHALQGAHADERIDELLLINLPAVTITLDHPGPASKTRRIMVDLADRGVRTLLLYAADDPGLLAMSRHFRPGADEAYQIPGCLVRVAPSLDHDLTGNAMRRLAAEQMIDVMQTPRGSAATAT